MFPQRTGSYRYGYNGKENDNEFKNIDGSSVDFGSRIYDSRLGRFISLDFYGFKCVDNSPYSYASNSPIRLIDVNGDYSGDPFDLTWSQLSGAAIQAGVWGEIKSQYSLLTNKVQWNLYKQRLGRIFEAAVLNSIDRQKNTKSFNGRIPDAVVETAAAKKEYDPVTQENKTVYYWWDEGAFLDAKTTQTQEVSFDAQIMTFVDVLSANTNAKKSDSPVFSGAGYGFQKEESAVNNEAAILHLITPAGTTISEDIVKYATSKGVIVWHSETEAKIDFDENNKAIYSLRVKNKSQLNFKKETSISSGTEGEFVPIDFDIK